MYVYLRDYVKHILTVTEQSFYFLDTQIFYQYLTLLTDKLRIVVFKSRMNQIQQEKEVTDNILKVVSALFC